MKKEEIAKIIHKTIRNSRHKLSEIFYEMWKTHFDLKDELKKVKDDELLDWLEIFDGWSKLEEYALKILRLVNEMNKEFSLFEEYYEEELVGRKNEEE